MHLTEAWLRQHSSAPSFERGETYYEQRRIKKLIREDDRFRGEVSGSKLYRQVIDLSGESPSLACTCPYSSGGYCKHLIAVGLAILAGEYHDATAPHPEVRSAVEPVAPETLRRAWQQLPDHLRLRFLRQALDKRPAWQQAFVRYVAGQTPPEQHVDRRQVQRQVADALAQIDLASLDYALPPDDSEGPEPSSWEDSAESLQVQLDRALLPPQTRLKELLTAHDWPNALLLLLGCFEGIEQARIQRLEAWEPWLDELQGSFQALYHRLIDALSWEIIPPRQAIWALQTWFARWQHYEQHLALNRPSHSIRYELTDWRTLLQVLTQEPSTAQFLRTRLDAYQLQDEAAAQLYAHLDRITD